MVGHNNGWYNAAVKRRLGNCLGHRLLTGKVMDRLSGCGLDTVMKKTIARVTCSRYPPGDSQTLTKSGFISWSKSPANQGIRQGLKISCQKTRIVVRIMVTDLAMSSVSTTIFISRSIIVRASNAADLTIYATLQKHHALS
jgi:hypothetical protein